MIRLTSPRELAAVVRLGLAAVACAPQSTPNQSPESSVRGEVVRLDRVRDPSPDWWWGLTNIFFAPVPSGIQSAVRAGEGWSAVELADVVMGDSLKTIYAARFKMPGSNQMHYVIDTAGNLDFAHAQSLTFQRRAHMLVANLELDVRSIAGTHRRIPYQVLLSDDGYTYARIAEYLSGHIRVNGHDYALQVRSGWRNAPFYGPTPNTVFLIDLDGDGTLAEQATVTAGGRPMAAEQVLPHTPFRLGGRALEVADLDSMGSRLVLRASNAEVAAVENFKAPELSAETLAGSRFKLSTQSGNVVLIEFWSVSCGFSEKVRPAVNDLAVRARGMPLTWVAMAREREPAEIQRYLVEHPMSATVTLSDSTAWATYNPAGVTPLFVVVDRNGIIRFRAVGATAIDAVAAKVTELLNSSPH